MNHRPLRRAIALSLLALLALAGTASADRLFADGDVLTPTIEGSKHLGNVSPGAEVSVDIGFVINCTGVAHVDAGQSVVLSGNGGIQPGDGLIVSVSTAVLDPAPIGWAGGWNGMSRSGAVAPWRCIQPRHPPRPHGAGQRLHVHGRVGSILPAGRQWG